MNIKKFASILVVFVLALGISSGINYALAAIAPTAAYPNCPASDPACNTPINVSTTNQIKNGGLGVGTFLASLAAQFKQSVTVDKLAGTGERLTCSDSNGTLTNCDSDLVGTLTVSTSGYCGSGVTTVPGSLKYYQIGTIVHVYGTIGINVNSSKDSICTKVSGLPKPFPSSGSPVITGAPAAFLYYKDSEWRDMSGSLQYNASNILNFNLFDNRQFIDPKTVPAPGEWLVYIDFTY